MNAWWYMHEGELSRDIGHDLLCAPHLAVLNVRSLFHCIFVSWRLCPLAEVQLLLLSAALHSFVQLVMLFPSCIVLSSRGFILCVDLTCLSVDSAPFPSSLTDCCASVRCTAF
jgi:hypothetical protein